MMQPEFLNWRGTQLLMSALGHDNLRFVGGCVRDSIRSRPVHDLDLATPLPVHAVMSLLQAANIKVMATGLQHGTVTAVVDSYLYEITTLRQDVACDGRHAQVQAVQDWQQDSCRRDFTCNALYLDATGHVHDYHGGVRDLEHGHIVFIGHAHQRIQEDHLRILRFFRFHASHGRGSINAAGLAACADLAASLRNISGERIQQEMTKLLRLPAAAWVLPIMHAHGILDFVLPFSIDVAQLTRLDWPACAETGVYASAIVLALLLRTTSNPHESLVQLQHAWKLSNACNDLLKLLAGTHLMPMAIMRTIKMHARCHGIEKMRAMACIALAERTMTAQEFKQVMHELQGWSVPMFPVSGHDLLARGMRQGQQLGNMLRDMEYYWEQHDYQPSAQDLVTKFLV